MWDRRLRVLQDAIGESMGIDYLPDKSLADMLGVHESTISFWKAGKREPRPKRAAAIEELEKEYGTYVYRS